MLCVAAARLEQNEGAGSSGAGGGSGRHGRGCEVRRKSSVTVTLFCVVRFTDTDYKTKEVTF